MPKYRTVGISPKVIIDAVVSVVAFLMLKYGIELDAEYAALIAKGVGTLGGVAAGPGEVEPVEGA